MQILKYASEGRREGAYPRFKSEEAAGQPGEREGGSMMNVNESAMLLSTLYSHPHRPVHTLQSPQPTCMAPGSHRPDQTDSSRCTS